MRYQKIALSFWMLLLSTIFSIGQKVKVENELEVGVPGQGNNLLRFNTERSWIFRQYDTGPSTALELYSTVGLKNFLITTTGNMGIGTLIPSEKLHVNGSIKADGPKISFGTSEYVNDAGSFLIECNGTLESTLDNTDFLGTSSRRWNSVYAVNGTINTSDINTKTNIQNISYGLDDILKLRPVSFNWIDRPEEGKKLGLIAQEVQGIIAEVVVDNELMRDEHSGQMIRQPAKLLGMYYSDLIPVLIKGMQEQQQLINDKQSHIEELDKKMEALEMRLLQLEQQLITVKN